MANQAHVCAPGVTLDECFAGRPSVQRDIYAAIIAYLDTLGEVHADVVRVGVFLKTGRKLAEIRPMARAVSLDLVLPRVIESPRVLRHIRTSAETIVHVIRLTGVDQVDDELRAWLAEAYDYATDYVR